MKSLTVGAFAQAAGVNLETVRYYERRGLLPEPARSDAGYRLYEPGDVARLQFIKRAQRLGFTLKEIKELLSLRVDGRRSCERVRCLAETKMEDIDHKMRDLQRMRHTLTGLIRSCRQRTQTSPCPILDSLSAGERHP